MTYASSINGSSINESSINASSINFKIFKREVWKHGRACDLKILKRDKNKKKIIG